MNKQTAQNLGTAMMSKLQELEKEFGVSFSRGNGSFGDNNLSIKFTATENSSIDGRKVSQMESDFLSHCVMHGLRKTDLNRAFKGVTGEIFTVCGLNPRARKTPIICSKGSTKYRFESSAVMRGLLESL
jgi:hypothetical protein